MGEGGAARAESHCSPTAAVRPHGGHSPAGLHIRPLPDRCRHPIRCGDRTTGPEGSGSPRVAHRRCVALCVCGGGGGGSGLGVRRSLSSVPTRRALRLPEPLVQGFHSGLLVANKELTPNSSRLKRKSRGWGSLACVAKAPGPSSGGGDRKFKGLRTKKKWPKDLVALPNFNLPKNIFQGPVGGGGDSCGGGGSDRPPYSSRFEHNGCIPCPAQETPLLSAPVCQWQVCPRAIRISKKRFGRGRGFRPFLHVSPPSRSFPAAPLTARTRETAELFSSVQTKRKRPSHRSFAADARASHQTTSRLHLITE